MILPLRCVGIDVSKHTLDIFDDAIGKPERIANAPQAGAGSHARCRALVLVGVAAPDRNVATLGVQRLRDADADAAVTAGDNSGAASEVEDAHVAILWVFPFCLARFRYASDDGQTFRGNHGQGHQENQIWVETSNLPIAQKNSA